MSNSFHQPPVNPGNGVEGPDAGLSQQHSVPNSEVAGTGIDRWLLGRLLPTLLGACSLLYAVTLIYHVSVPENSGEQIAILEHCRQLCLKAGLLSNSPAGEEFPTYVTSTGNRPLSTALNAILSDPAVPKYASEEHPLLGHKAPDFLLTDPEGMSHSLSEFTSGGPVLVVFNYGYSCEHCVEQLKALQEDIHFFAELGASIVTLSSESPESSLDAFSKFGRFDFQVLYDQADQVASQYGCYSTPTLSSEETRQHGTFLIDASGHVMWAYRGQLPFAQNRSLLKQIAALTQQDSDVVASNP
ncbi:MAG: TlpA family protein disulfide reductase [Planctomyces sp.]|nr:TlpA family protein disulfide reductase [Planctomyces sp.]